MLSMNVTTTNSTPLFVTPIKRLSPFLLWLLNTSRSILPKSFRASDKQVLIIWLVLSTLALGLFAFIMSFMYYQHKKRGNYQVNSSSHEFIRFDKNPSDHRTIFNLKFNCKNHKCLCQYRRHNHSTMSLTKSRSIILSNLELNNPIQPLIIQPMELRYAKIKRISSTKDIHNDYLAGRFRTIVKLKSLPD